MMLGGLWSKELPKPDPKRCRSADLVGVNKGRNTNPFSILCDLWEKSATALEKMQLGRDRGVYPNQG